MGEYSVSGKKLLVNARVFLQKVLYAPMSGNTQMHGDRYAFRRGGPAATPRFYTLRESPSRASRL